MMRRSRRCAGCSRPCYLNHGPQKAKTRLRVPGLQSLSLSLWSGRADSTAAITELMREPHENRGLRLGLPDGNPSAFESAAGISRPVGPVAAVPQLFSLSNFNGLRRILAGRENARTDQSSVT